MPQPDDGLSRLIAQTVAGVTWFGDVTATEITAGQASLPQKNLWNGHFSR